MAEWDDAAGGWRKSSWSTDTGCVEVRQREDSVHVRHSRDPAGPMLVFTAPEWRAFLAGVRGGEFGAPPR
jgi:hypothetical protein